MPPPKNNPSMTYSLTADTLPDAAKLFAELEDTLAEAERLQEAIELVFNQSDVRRFLHGFVANARSEFTLEWHGATATVKL